MLTWGLGTDIAVRSLTARINFHRAAELIDFRPTGHEWTQLIRAAEDDPRGQGRAAGRAGVGVGGRGRAGPGQRKALIPVMARPTINDWIESVPS